MKKSKEVLKKELKSLEDQYIRLDEMVHRYETILGNTTVQREEVLGEIRDLRKGIERLENGKEKI